MRHLIAVSIFALTASTAMAADLPVVAPAAASAIDWTGFYAGVFAGANQQQGDLPGAYSYYYGDYYGDYYGGGDGSKFGGEVGVAAGYNAQIGSFVLGAEADIAWSPNTVINDVYEAYTVSDISWLGTLRAKAGVVVGDSAVVYGTAGVAAAQIDYSLCYDSSCYDGIYSEGTRLGLTVGVGAEAMIADNLSVDAKLLYTQFETTEVTPYYSGYGQTGFDTSLLSARVGLNWHLN